MGCFPCLSSQQVRYERERDMLAQALHAPHVAHSANASVEQRPFADLPRSGATHAFAAATALPVQRAHSIDFKKFEQDLLTWQNAGAPSQHEHRQRAARQFRSAKRMRDTSLTLQHLELDDLPECLAAMVNLTELELRHCRIGALLAVPPHLLRLQANGVGLSHLSRLPACLKVLALDYNLLETLPDLPAQLIDFSCNNNRLRTLPTLPQGLRRLSIAFNRLHELPALPATLEWLGAASNRLTALPEIPAKTSNMEAQDNRLTDLPLSITEMTDLKWISVFNNPLPVAVLERVAAAIARRTDNVIMYSELYNDISSKRRYVKIFEAAADPAMALPTPPLVAAVMAWYDRMPDCGTRRGERWENWEVAHCRALGTPERNPLASFVKFLDRVCETAEFREPRLRPGLTARVCRLLDRLPGNDGLRTQCYALATDALGDCQDRIAAGLDHMELCALSADASAGLLDPAHIRTLGLGMLKLEELHTICAELVKNHPAIDEVELHLALRTEYASALDLPTTTQKMHYAPPSEITASEWNAVQSRVETAVSDRERQITFLSAWLPWQASLQRQAFPQLAEAHADKSSQELHLQAALDVAMDKLGGLPPEAHECSQAYFDIHAEIACLNHAFNHLEQQLIDPVRQQLTRALLNAEHDYV